MGGSFCRHTPLASVVLVNLPPLKNVVTSEPGASKPHTVAGVPRCSTMWSPSVALNVSAFAAVAAAAAARSALARAMEVERDGGSGRPA